MERCSTRRYETKLLLVPKCNALSLLSSESETALPIVEGKRLRGYYFKQKAGQKLAHGVLIA